MFNIGKITFSALIVLSLGGLSPICAAFNEENFYDQLTIQYVPQEIKKLFPRNQPIIAHAIGHLNDDQYWDAVVITTTSEELLKGKAQQLVPRKKTVHLLLGNENGFQRTLSHAYLFQDRPEPADALINPMLTIQNHKISKMTHATHDVFGDQAKIPATGGFQIRQAFDTRNSTGIGFIWDPKQQTWIYDGANIFMEIPNGAQILKLDTDEETRYPLADFYIDHPSKGNLIYFDGQHYIDQIETEDQE